MKKYIFGTRGFAKEVEFMIVSTLGSNSLVPIEIIFVGEDESEDLNAPINGRQVISESEFFKITDNVDCFIAVGSPNAKKKIVDKLIGKANIFFPNLIHPTVVYDKRYTAMGQGNIICSHASLTTNIKLGNFVHINLNCTVGHDTNIGNFVTASPGANISGNVTIEDLVYLGTNSIIIEKKKIEKNVIIGAGTVVIKDILEAGTYVGMPAKKIK